MSIIPASSPIVFQSTASIACSWPIVCVTRTSDRAEQRDLRPVDPLGGDRREREGEDGYGEDQTGLPVEGMRRRAPTSLPGSPVEGAYRAIDANADSRPSRRYVVSQKFAGAALGVSDADERIDRLKRLPATTRASRRRAAGTPAASRMPRSRSRLSRSTT